MQLLHGKLIAYDSPPWQLPVPVLTWFLCQGMHNLQIGSLLIAIANSILISTCLIIGYWGK